MTNLMSNKMLSRRIFLKNTLTASLSLSCVSVVHGDNDRDHVNEKNLAVLTRSADIILPRTSTPSATDSNAHVFVIAFVAGAKSYEFVLRFYRGFEEYSKNLEKKYNNNFAHISDDDMRAHLQSVLNKGGDSDEHWTMNRFRSLLLIGWALNKSTAEAAFNYKGGFYQYIPSTQSSQIIMGDYINKEYINL